MEYEPTQVGLEDSDANDVIEQVDAIGGPMSEFLENAKDALELLDQFLVQNAEPFAIAAQLIINEIDNIREDLFESGIKLKVIDPFKYGRNTRTNVKQNLLGQLVVDEAQTPTQLSNWADQQVLTIQNSKLPPPLSFKQANRILISTITNPGINAPTYSGPVEALNIVFVTVSPSDLLPLLEAFSAIFKFPELERARRRLGSTLAKQGVHLTWQTDGTELGFKIYEKGAEKALLDARKRSFHDNSAPGPATKSDYAVKATINKEGQQSEVDVEFTFSQLKDEDLRTNKDDWKAYTPVKLIPGAVEANDMLKQALYDMGVYAKAGQGGIQAASKAIKNKTDQINGYTEKYENLKAVIKNGEKSGCYVGQYSGTTGVDDLVKDMENSIGVPDGLNFCVIASFVGGTAGLDGLKILLGL